MSSAATQSKVNYTEYEEELILQLVEEATDVIESRKTDGRSILQKKKAWNDLVKKFNASDEISHKRNAAQLKTKWKNIKSTAKKAIASERRSKRKTGGGSEEDEPSDKAVRIASMLPDQIYPLNNPFDDDSEFLDNHADNTPDENSFIRVDPQTSHGEIVGTETVNTAPDFGTQFETNDLPGPSGSSMDQRKKKPPTRLTATQTQIIELAREEHDIKSSKVSTSSSSASVKLSIFSAQDLNLK